jgi:hypothetical protein
MSPSVDLISGDRCINAAAFSRSDGHVCMFSWEFELLAVRLREGARVQGIDEGGRASVRRTRESQQENLLNDSARVDSCFCNPLLCL